MKLINEYMLAIWQPKAKIHIQKYSYIISDLTNRSKEEELFLVVINYTESSSTSEEIWWYRKGLYESASPVNSIPTSFTSLV